MENKLSKKRLLFNLIFMIILTSLVLNFILRGEDKREIISIVSLTDKKYIFLGIILSLMFILGEALNIKNTLDMINCKTSFLKTIKYAFTGFFFSGITPSASGGQPMQVYNMNKDGIEVSQASLALLLELLSTQIISFLYGLIGLVWFKDIFIANNRGVLYLISGGLFIKIVGIIFILTCIFNPKVSIKLYKLLSLLINKLPILKMEKKESLIKALKNQIEEYNKCAVYIKNKRDIFIFIKVLLRTILQMASLFSISYVVYRSFGQSSYSLLDIVFLQGLIYTGSSFLPLPGGVGVSESTFLSVFKEIYSKNLISSAMLLSRGISFYLLLIISLLSLILIRIAELNDRKKFNKRKYGRKEVYFK